MDLRKINTLIYDKASLCNCELLVIIKTSCTGYRKDYFYKISLNNVSYCQLILQIASEDFLTVLLILLISPFLKPEQTFQKCSSELQKLPAWNILMYLFQFLLSLRRLNDCHQSLLLCMCARACACVCVCKHVCKEACKHLFKGVNGWMGQRRRVICGLNIWEREQERAGQSALIKSVFYIYVFKVFFWKKSSSSDFVSGLPACSWFEDFRYLLFLSSHID